MSQLDKIEELIRDLYSVVAKLHDAFPGRPFTPDGRLIGDIGETIADLEFDLVLDKKVKKHWDGYWIDSGEKKHDIQIKATGKNDTYLKEPPDEGTFLVFKIFSDGKHEVIYNGSIMRVWDKLINKKDIQGKMISLQNLKKLNLDVDPEKIKSYKNRK